MSFERGKRQVDHGAGGRATSRSIAPGKTTLTEALRPHQGHPGVAPPASAARPDGVAPSRAATRQLVLADDDGCEVAAEPGGPAGGGGMDWAAMALEAADPGGVERAELAAAAEHPAGEVDDKPRPPALMQRSGVPDLAVTVAGSAADTEAASDDNFTPALIAALAANPTLSFAEVLRQLAQDALNIGRVEDDNLQHPTVVEYGQIAAPPDDGHAPSRRAVLVGNQHYAAGDQLQTPIAEAQAMQGQLAARGFEASVHVDRTAVDMATLWGGMVGAARPGDELVAFYGGHGGPEGLYGVGHGLRSPPDVFTTSQVTDVVSAATGHGARIRFVMDSCHSGSAAQAAREVRENELAAVVTSPGHHVRVAILAALRRAKQRLIAILDQRWAIVCAADRARGLRHMQGADGDAAYVRIPDAFDRAVEELWATQSRSLRRLTAAIGHREPPPPISCYADLGAQLNYLDEVWNALARPVEEAATPPRGAAGLASPR